MSGEHCEELLAHVRQQFDAILHVRILLLVNCFFSGCSIQPLFAHDGNFLSKAAVEGAISTGKDLGVVGVELGVLPQSCL